MKHSACLIFLVGSGSLFDLNMEMIKLKWMKLIKINLLKFREMIDIIGKHKLKI